MTKVTVREGLEWREGGERRARLLGLLVGGKDGAFGTKRLCEVCAEATAVSGAGIMLMSDEVPQGSLCTTNEMSNVIEQLQYALGEGPCVDAYRQDWPVLEPDLAHPQTPRWLAFAPPAIEAGVRAVFGFPLQVGAVRLGALNLCCDRAGPLSDDQHADALVMADIAAQAVLVLQTGAPPGKLAAALGAGADFHYVVHQAAGMVAAQLGVSVREALVRLRAYAFGNDRPLTEVAQGVVGRKMRFDAVSGEVHHR
jgi:GAF domain-containing protein